VNAVWRIPEVWRIPAAYDQRDTFSVCSERVRVKWMVTELVNE